MRIPPSMAMFRNFRKASSIRTGVAVSLIAIGCGGGGDVTGPSGGGGGLTSVASVAVTAPSTTLLVGVTDTVGLGTVTAVATPMGANGSSLTGRTVSWSSSSTSVATVTSSGVITAVAAGTANIIATSEGKSGQIAITVVRPPVAQVAVVPQTSSLKVGATETLAVTLLDAQAHSLTGRLISAVNNSPSVISVSAGQVTGVSAGTGTVKFSSEGASTIATITVTP